MTISGGRTKQLDIFCRVTGFTSDFSQFHSCGTYSVLSRSHSTVQHKTFCQRHCNPSLIWLILYPLQDPDCDWTSSKTSSALHSKRYHLQKFHQNPSITLQRKYTYKPGKETKSMQLTAFPNDISTSSRKMVIHTDTRSCTIQRAQTEHRF